MRTQTTSDAALRAIHMIRLAWFDEQMDAEARGDLAAAMRAKQNLTACELQIRQLEKRVPERQSG